MEIFEMGYTHVGECRWAADDDILDWVWKEHGIGVPIASTWVPRRGSLKGKCGKVDYPVGLNPIFSARARDVFADLLDPWGEWLALDTSNGGDYYVYHLLTFRDVLDAPSSEILTRAAAFLRLIASSSGLPISTRMCTSLGWLN